MRKKVTEMTHKEFMLVEDFKKEHDIVRPVKAATFFWNAVLQRNQVMEVETSIHPFEYKVSA